MLLSGKNALIYGVSDSLGGAVAKAFAKEGAHVYVSGLDIHKVQPIADAINQRGGKAYASVVDALDERAVQQQVNELVAAGKTR